MTLFAASPPTPAQQRRTGALFPALDRVHAHGAGAPAQGQGHVQGQRDTRQGLQPKKLLLPGLDTGREVLGLEVAPVGGPSFTPAPKAPRDAGTGMTCRVRPLKLPLYFPFLQQDGL